MRRSRTKGEEGKTNGRDCGHAFMPSLSEALKLQVEDSRRNRKEKDTPPLLAHSWLNPAALVPVGCARNLPCDRELHGAPTVWTMSYCSEHAALHAKPPGIRHTQHPEPTASEGWLVGTGDKKRPVARRTYRHVHRKPTVPGMTNLLRADVLRSWTLETIRGGRFCMRM